MPKKCSEKAQKMERAVEASEKKAGKPAAEAKQIANATVNKAKGKGKV